MIISVHQLALNEVFRIAHGSSTQRTVIRAETAQGITAEAPLVPYYGETADRVIEELHACSTDPQARAETKAAQLILDVLQTRTAAQKAGRPLWQHHSLPDPRSIITVRSLSIPEDLDSLQEIIRQRAASYPTLKLKLGSGNVDFDEAIVAKAREAAPTTTLIADINGGWSPTEAAQLSVRLQRWGLSMIEQPVTHQHGLEPWRALRSHQTSRSIPLFADESAQTSADLAGLSGLADGVNVKVLKTGGFTTALSMLHQAQDMGFITMIGCMIESSLGILPARHLAALGTWADLDGPLYLQSDDQAQALQHSLITS
jgi:L-Ala-D/L-Glu epimerase